MRLLIVFIALVSFSLPLAAQVSGAPVAESTVSYEGQKVSSVDLITDPRVEVESLRPLVVQGAGEPYSNKKIQASVDAFKQTGKFSKIEVSVVPEVSGLRVSFVLEPAFYLGILQFPGAKTFRYTRLLQVVSLPDEDPYEKSRILEARQALLKFFAANGYFQAEVETETNLDDAHKLANVTFHISLGKRARIGNVEITGTSSEEADHLLKTVHSLRATASGASLKSGKAFSERRLKSATSLLKKHLAKEDRLANKVQISTARFHPYTNRADLTVHVEEGPVVKVAVTGARLSFLPFLAHRRMHKLIPVYEEGAVDQDLVEEGRQNLINYFQRKGYFNVSVEANLQQQPSGVFLEYRIDEKSRYKLDRIAFEGAHQFSSDELLRHITLKKRRWFGHGAYSEKLLKQSVDNLKILYQNEGYEDVAVTSQVSDIAPGLGVVFQIAEGPQTIVASLNIVGNRSLPIPDLSPRNGLQLRSGSPFSPQRANRDRGQILARYLDRGYLNADVKAMITRHPEDRHRVDVTYQITERQQVRVSDVVLLGDDHTRPSLITKTADIHPETPLSQGKLLAGESSLYDLGIFDWSSVGPRRPITDQKEEETVIKVHESRRNTIAYGVGFEIARRGGNVPTGTVAVPGLPAVSLNNVNVTANEQTFASPRGSIEYARRNLRGLGETGAISLLVARLDQRALATYTDPHFRGSKWSSLFSLSAERTTENPIFTARLGEASFQVERSINHAKNIIAQLRYRFQRTVLSDLLIPELVLPQDRSVRLSSIGGTLIRDTRDKPLDAHRGFYQTLDFALNPKLLGSSASFSRMLAQDAYYKQVGPVVLANSLRLGFAIPFGDSDVPTSELFFTGGGTSLRGFPINGAGPQRNVPFCANSSDPSTCTTLVVPVGGKQLVILNSEVRFPLPIKEGLGGVVFYDGGNVFSAIRFSSITQNYSNTIGFGLRYNTPVGPVRFDIGRNLNPITGVSATQFFITLGQAF